MRDRIDRTNQWGGVVKDTAPFALPDGAFQEDENGDRYFRGVWRRRKGLSRSGVPKTSAAIRTILGFETPGEDFALLYDEGVNSRGVTNPTEQDDGTQTSASLHTTWSANHRRCAAEYRRVGYLTNGWNSVRRWDGQTSALELAGIEGPSRDDGDWQPSSTSGDVTVVSDVQGVRVYRYRYMDSRTGYVSNPSNEVAAFDLTDGGYYADNNITFNVGGTGSTVGPDSTGTGFAIAASTVTRNDAGSWVTDGYKVGDYFTVANAENAGNNGVRGPLSVVTAGVITIASTVAGERNQADFPTVNADDTTVTFARHTKGRIQASSDSKVDKIVIESTTAGSSEFFVAGEFLNTATTCAVTITDAELEQKILPWSDEGHDVPPITKNILSHRDRLWCFGQVTHETGTADFTNNSVNVGDGSTAPDWNTEVLGTSTIDPSVQWMIQKAGDTAAYEIDYFDSGGAQIVLKKAYAGSTSTNSSYKIFSRTNVIWLSEPGYPESFEPLNFLNGPNGESAGDITAGVGYGSSVLFFSLSGMTKFAWDIDPHQDGSLTPLSNKAGALNQRVALEVEGTVYTMDRRGWHAWDGVFPKLISRAIEPLRDSIDYTKAEQFHACYFPEIRAIRWFVNYSSDSSTYPKRYVQFDIDTGAWSTGRHLQEISESRLINTAEGLRVLLGDSQGHSWFADTGLADGCAAAYSHVTVDTGATTTSVPVTGLTLPTSGVGLAGCYLTKRSSAGVLENVLITSNTSTTITCAAFAQAPTAGSVLWIGIIPAKLKTRAFGSPIALAGKKQTGKLVLAFEPISGTRYLQVRAYEDYSATAKTWATYSSQNAPHSGILAWPGATSGYPTSDWLVNLSRSDGLVPVPFGMEFKRYFEVELEINEPDADFMLCAFEFDGLSLKEDRK